MDEACCDFHNDTEVVKKMEDEHMRLQRQFRGIQTDRLHRTMGVHPQCQRQDHLLRTLKKEYINLKKDLKIARSGAHKKYDKKKRSDLFRLLQNWVVAEHDIEGGLYIMKELDELLQMDKKEMMTLRKLAIANKGQLDARRSHSENRLVSAENKLESAMLRFNAIQYENKKIRAEIEHMLKDRALFNQAWDKMLSALGKGKKFLSDLFESSTLAYDQRDEWCAKLRSIQEKGRMDQQMQVQEMRDLKQAHDHEMKTHRFLAKKGLIRINKKQEQREIDFKKKMEDDIEREFDEHVKILNEIHNYTKEPCYDRIIDAFVKRECHNFSIYNLLTDYCAENEVLRRDLEAIRTNIVDRKDQNEITAANRHNNFEKLKEELELQKAKTETLRNKLEDQDVLLNTTMEQIHEMFTMLDCSLEPFQNLLGDKHPSIYTLNLSLLLITEKIKENVEVVYYRERALKLKDKTPATSRLKRYTVHSELPLIFTPVPITQLVPSDPCPSCIESRWLSRFCDQPESPLSGAQCVSALAQLAAEPAYVRSDRVHALADCRATASRRLLATRHMQF